MTAALLSMILVNAQLEPITWHVRPTSLPGAVAQLSELAHRKLVVSDELKGLTVLVNVKGARVADVLQHMADTVAGDWVDRDGTLLLRRSGSKTAALEKEFFEKKLAYLRKTFAPFGAASLEPYTETRLAQKMQEQREYYQRVESGLVKKGEKPPVIEDPNTRILARLKNDLPLTELAGLAAGQRIVYCTRPTRMQRTMSPRILSVLELARGESEVYERVSRQIYSQDEERVDAPPSTVPADSSPVETPVAPDEPRKQKPLGPCTVATIAISRTEGEFSGMYQLIILGYDDSGQVVASASFGAGIGALNQDSGNVGGEPDVETKPIPNVEFPLNPFAAEIKTLMSASTGVDVLGRVASDTMMKYLLDPVQFDPLDSAPADGLDFIAKDQKQNLIAVMDDSWFFMNLMASMYRNNPDPCEMFGPLTARRVIENGWTQYTPYELRELPTRKISRDALATFIKGAKQRGGVSLDNMAKFSIQSDTMFMESLGVFYLWFLDQGLANAAFQFGSDSWLRVFGYLPGSLREDLARGRQIPYSVLPGPVKRKIFDMVYGANMGDSGSDYDDAATQAPSAPTETEDPSPEPWRYEPTFALPDNIPQATYLTGKVTSMTVLYPAPSKDPKLVTAYPMETRTIAYMLAMKELQMDSGGRESTARFFALGAQKRWSIEVVLSPTTRKKGTLIDAEPIDRTQLFTIEQLPEPLRLEIEKYKEEYKKSLKEQPAGSPGDDGNTTPPR